ncbi:Pkinase-domain-containing protein [Wilcoxina mikolae CBS 423.85]|nr:Pkinase-domain-containing protein [Wilcoxina mikolae CBS 423.85]
MLAPPLDDSTKTGAENRSSVPVRPPVVRHISSPVEGYRSPLRHHRRTPSVGRAPVKETLDASLSYEDDEDGGSEMRINQYILKQEIGRGSFGAVHLAVDQLGKQYAVKEFSKSRLRKRSQSNILRRPHAAQRGGFLNPQGHRRTASDIHREQESRNPLYLIREEIAILKKLDHENVVNLIEVLDDPEGDSLYMVLEMCEKGVVMKVNLDQIAEPYPEEQCRLWFRDMILGIEYLHAQGIVHRDIKPDNLLLTADDVLKIVDFGVSEMFEKNAPMITAKSAGSPAFLPPELCVAGHGDVSGAAADIWSMGVTLYCLLFGCLPFNHRSMMELYEGIKHDPVHIPDTTSPQLTDLLMQLLEKNPAKRIKMPELRNHPWVTRGGSDMLLPEEENTADIILPTEEEMASAITKSIHNVLAVVRAVRKLKRLTLGRLKPPSSSAATSTQEEVGEPRRSQSLTSDDRGHYQQQLNISGVNTEISLDNLVHALPADTEGIPSPDSDQLTENPSDVPPLIEVQGVYGSNPENRVTTECTVQEQTVLSVDDKPPIYPVIDILNNALTQQSVHHPAILESPSPIDRDLSDEVHHAKGHIIHQDRG